MWVRKKKRDGFPSKGAHLIVWSSQWAEPYPPPYTRSESMGGCCPATALPHLGQVTRLISHINIASFNIMVSGPACIFVTNDQACSMRRHNTLCAFMIKTDKSEINRFKTDILFECLDRDGNRKKYKYVYNYIYSLCVQIDRYRLYASDKVPFPGIPLEA